MVHRRGGGRCRTARRQEIITLAILYSLGAHGIMTLNDFKSIEGDRRLGVRSLPVQLGVRRAVQLACIVMAAPQVVVMDSCCPGGARSLPLSWPRCSLASSS